MQKNETPTPTSEVHVKRFKEKEVGIPKVGEQIIFPCANGVIELAEGGPNHHTSNPSRSGCLLREDDDGSGLVKETTTLNAVFGRITLFKSVGY